MRVVAAICDDLVDIILYFVDLTGNGETKVLHNVTTRLTHQVFADPDGIGENFRLGYLHAHIFLDILKQEDDAVTQADQWMWVAFFFQINGEVTTGEMDKKI